MRILTIALAIVCAAMIVLGAGGCRFIRTGALGARENFLQFTGQFALTPAIQLKGERSFEGSHLEGRYAASYDGFSGTECLFGDASTHARAVEVSLHLTAESGTGALVVVTGFKKTRTLWQGEGAYAGVVELPAGGGYIAFTGKALTGTLELKLTRS